MSVRLIAATLVTLAAPCGIACAQKPALTQDADEPGRNPYQEFSGNMVKGLTASFSAVPAGKRLVVKHLNCDFTTAATTPLIVSVNLGSGTPPGRTFFPMNLLKFVVVPTPVTGQGLAGLDTELLAFVEPGQRPGIDVSTLAPIVSFTCLLSGYYITL